MPNLHRVIAQLRLERDRAEREVQRLEEAIHVLERLDRRGKTETRGNSGTAQHVSDATRARMAAAQRARWARRKAAQNSKPRVLSATARRKIAAAQRARWARQKAEQTKAA